MHIYDSSHPPYELPQYIETIANFYPNPKRQNYD